MKNITMASGGVEVPVPPKRPTVIRPSKPPDQDGSPPTPARPAPPVPGRPAPAIPARTNDAGPSRPQPPVPVRQEDQKSQGLSSMTGRPPPPVPGRPHDVAQNNLNGHEVPSQSPRLPPQSTKSTERNNSVKVKPEITIVCARPMNEVGFRSQSAATSKPSTDSSKPEASVPPRPKPPPPKPDPPLIDFNDDPPDTSDNQGAAKDVDTVPRRGPPPPVPPVSTGKPKVSAVPPAVPPAPPERLVPSQRPEPSPVPAKRITNEYPPVPQHTAVDTDEHETNVKKVNPKIGVPLPPVPRNPPAPGRPPPAPGRPPPATQVFRQTHNSEDIMPHNNQNNTDDSDRKKINNVDNITETGDNDADDNTYAVINKPKRPTIIRPGRPGIKGDTVEDSTKLSEPPKLPPKIVPRLMDSDDSSPSESVDSPSKDNTPEFLKLKLKTTVQENSVAANSEKTTTPSSSTGVRGAPKDSSPPGVAPKPKPAVLPKPKIAAKPNIAAKPVVAKPLSENSDVTDKKVPLEVNKHTNDETPEQSEEKTEPPLRKTPGSVKRPTIIRPGRPGQFGSSENIRKEATYNESENVDLKASVDDSIVRSRPQPPLPTKRPVSMSNIPQALAQEAALSQGITSSQSVKSSFSSSESLGVPSVQQLQPSPRPVARSRPMSVAAGDGIGVRVLPPNISPRLQNSSKKLTQDLDTKEAVKSEMEPPRPPPPKPTRVPQISPRAAEKKASSSSEDDEFVMAQTKPDRPKGPPRPAQRISMQESEVKKSPPARPGGLPLAPRKLSNPEEHDTVAEADTVKMRPARPGSKPSRPMSMPVKSILPSKPQLPKSSKKRGIPDLPARPGPGHPVYHHMMSVPHGQAVFDYTARHDDELSFKQGDIIILVRAVDAEWVMGKIDEVEGMFPRGFVKVLMPLPGETADVESSDENEDFYDTSPEKPDLIGHGPRCRARFDFEGEGREDLAFEEGDVIRLLERVGMEWRRGECNGRTGLFPLGYVEVIEDLPADDSNISNTVVTALFDFDGEDGELSFKSGEMIQVKYSVNEEWLFGEIGNRVGQFPTQFIDHVPSDLPPLPREAKIESSPLQANMASGSTYKIADALSQWDTVDNETEIKAQEVASLKAKGDTGRSHETPYCIALYDYPGQTDEDLSFREGDRIELVERIGAEWLKGKVSGNVGMFPAGFVDVKVDIGVTTKPSQSSDITEGILTVALYDFQGEADNELKFHAGDQLVVQELVEGAEDWRWALHEGRRGIFPAAFVSIDS